MPTNEPQVRIFIDEYDALRDASVATAGDTGHMRVGADLVELRARFSLTAVRHHYVDMFPADHAQRARRTARCGEDL